MLVHVIVVVVAVVVVVVVIVVVIVIVVVKVKHSAISEMLNQITLKIVDFLKKKEKK